MKLNGKTLVAVVMMLGSMATMGCKKAAPPAGEPEATPVQAEPAGTEVPAVAAPADTEGPAAAAPAPAPAEERSGVVVSASLQRPAPPALRDENPGPSPGARHVWQRGYWRYDAPRTTYVWAPGYWADTSVYAPSAPPVAVYEEMGYAPSADYLYVPGYWHWGGREYVWSYGHWSHRRDVGYYYRPSYVHTNGRWAYRADRWDHAGLRTWNREHGTRGHYADRGNHGGHGRPDHGGHGPGNHGHDQGNHGHGQGNHGPSNHGPGNHGQGNHGHDQGNHGHQAAAPHSDGGHHGGNGHPNGGHQGASPRAGEHHPRPTAGAAHHPAPSAGPTRPAVQTRAVTAMPSRQAPVRSAGPSRRGR